MALAQKLLKPFSQVGKERNINIYKYLSTAN